MGARRKDADFFFCSRSSSLGPAARGNPKREHGRRQVRCPVPAEPRKLVGEAENAVVRMPSEKAAAAAAGRAGAAAATRSATRPARREVRLGGAGGVGCGCEDSRRGDATPVVLRRKGGLAGGAAGEWMALIARRTAVNGCRVGLGRGGIALPLCVGLQTLQDVQLSKSTRGIPYWEHILVHRAHGISVHMLNGLNHL